MTTAHFTARRGAGRRPPKTDLFHAAYMYLSAKIEGDEFRIEAAGRHLEFIADLQMLADPDSAGSTNGSAR